MQFVVITGVHLPALAERLSLLRVNISPERPGHTLVPSTESLEHAPMQSLHLTWKPKNICSGSNHPGRESHDLADKTLRCCAHKENFMLKGLVGFYLTLPQWVQHLSQQLEQDLVQPGPFREPRVGDEFRNWVFWWGYRSQGSVGQTYSVSKKAEGGSWVSKTDWISVGTLPPAFCFQ